MRHQLSRVYLSVLGPALFAALCGHAAAQAISAKPLTLSGLYSVDSGLAAPQANFTAVQLDSSKNIYLLLDEGDGVRVIKLNPAGNTRLATAHLGANGDHGLAMALDASGNVYHSRLIVVRKTELDRRGRLQWLAARDS